MIIKLILFLLIFLLAYNIGYKHGEKDAYKKAKTSISLEYLESSLKKGYCLICKKKL